MQALTLFFVIKDRSFDIYNTVKFCHVQLCPIYYPLTATFRVSFSCVFNTILQVICMSSDVFVLTSFQCLSDFMIQTFIAG